MRALVTGANGFLGTWLTRRLAERGDEVRVLLRSSADEWGLSRLQVQRFQGDITDPASLLPAAKGVDVVFHLAGIRRAPAKEIFDRVNGEGTRHVCEAAVAGGARRVLLCGSLAANGPSRPDRPKVETDPFAPFEWYGESKAASEQIAFSYRDRLEVVAARPSRIVGPGDRENLTFFKLVKRGVKLAVAGPRRPLSMVDVEDVVDALLLMADRKEAAGEAFFVSSAETSTVEELQEEAARQLDARPRRVVLPGPVLYGIGAVADAVSRVTGKHLPVNRKLARQLLAPAWTCSIEKARRMLGYEPKVTLAESIRRSIAWYRENGWL
jgi:nucleoside-diphosphate-sugar epimerase